jgi:hypothetical protein
MLRCGSGGAGLEYTEQLVARRIRVKTAGRSVRGNLLSTLPDVLTGRGAVGKLFTSPDGARHDWPDNGHVGLLYLGLAP